MVLKLKQRLNNWHLYSAYDYHHFLNGHLYTLRTVLNQQCNLDYYTPSWRIAASVGPEMNHYLFYQSQGWSGLTAGRWQGSFAHPELFLAHCAASPHQKVPGILSFRIFKLRVFSHFQIEDFFAFSN